MFGSFVLIVDSRSASWFQSARDIGLDWKLHHSSPIIFKMTDQNSLFRILA